ncbi:hypothetical protein IAU60_000730 [Kwoniella sp. DSM 27419]
MSPPPPDIPLPHLLAEAEQRAQAEIDAQRRRKGAWLTAPSRGGVLRVLTMSQNTSAMVFTLFMVPHLASPVMAAVGGLSAADKTMMIARDLYLPLEPALVYAPLAIHFTSSFLRRLVLLTPTRASSDTSPSPWPWSSIRARLPRQIHQIIAYPLAIMIVPHILTHRLVPSRSAPPISSLSPSELGWEYVGYNLRDWFSWAAYLGIVGAGVWHAAVGSMKIVSWLKGRSTNTTPATTVTGPPLENNGTAQDTARTRTDPATGEQRPVIPRRNKLGLRGIMIIFLGVITIGLVRVARDTGSVSTVMKRRYDAVRAAVPWANLWR